MELTVSFSKKERPYRGPELRPHFLYTELGVKGSGIGAFVGPCSVQPSQMVDWEDRMSSDRIEAKSMLHFIGEFFGVTLREGVLAQHLFMAIAAEELNKMLDEPRVTRSGDDLFVGSRKLSVSIATASPVSQLIHVGLNIDPEGAPVSAIGLAELGISVEDLTQRLLESLKTEWSGMEWATHKVRPVV